MSLWRQIARGLEALIHRSAADRDIDDEVQYFFDRTVAEYVAGGMARDDAMRAARRLLGGASEEVRESGWEATVDQIMGDARYAFRRLRSSPGFTTVGAVTLAIGIGASTAIFSAVNSILFEPLPYPDAHHIVMISDHGENGERADVTFGTYAELIARTRSFSNLAVAKPWQPTLLGAAEPERLDGQRVSASYFRTLDISPRLGHDFDSSDDRPRGANVAIVSDALWRRRLNSDPSVIGRQITLDGARYTVIGVMPAGFENILSPSAEIWSLLQYESRAPFIAREWGHHLVMLGRVRPDVSVATAGREVERIAGAPAPEFARPSWASLGQGLIVHSLQDDVTSPVRPALLAILGAVLLVLAIACVNVTNLLLARGAQRRGELAMRAALGASRWRITRQLVTESLLLAVVGGALGLIVAAVGTRALIALSPSELPRVSAIRIDAGAFAFACALTTLVGLLVGVIPAMHSTRVESARHTARTYAMRGALVVTEVALALVVLVSAGLLLRSLARLFSVSPGFTPSHVLTMQVQDDSGHDQFFPDALDAVRRVPGVTAAAFTSQLPLSGDYDGYGARLESTASDDYRSALRYTVTPGYVEAMGIALRRGRLFDEHDRAGAPPVVLVSESFARRNFGSEDPIGHRLQFGPDTTWAAIIGVVGDVKQASLAINSDDAVYVTAAQWLWVDSKQSLVVRTSGNAALLASAIKVAIWSVDKDRPIVRVSTMDDLLARSAAQRRFALIVFEAFAVVALGLAAIGLYGVLSGSVTERLREIGVRSALGASPTDVLRLILRQGMTLAVLGIAVGLFGATVAGRAIVGLLFGISWLDPVTYLAVIALLLAVAGLACWLPARRACGLDPVAALRAS